MSDDPDHGATTIRASKGEDEGGGGARKWLLGGLAAVVLAGAGYFGWQAMSNNNPSEQTAYNDTYADGEPTYAGPIGPGEDTSAESASVDDSVAEPAASAPRAAAPARRSTAARTQEVPEETIGITPVNATGAEAASASTDNDDIIVHAPRRPVWARTPSERRLSSLYPARALERGREGEASLQCIVLDGGALDCSKVSETPGGFGNAALRVARNFRHASTTRDGHDAVGTPVNLRVVFRIEDDGRGRRYASN